MERYVVDGDVAVESEQEEGVHAQELEDCPDHAAYIAQ